MVFEVVFEMVFEVDAIGDDWGGKASHRHESWPSVSRGVPVAHILG